MQALSQALATVLREVERGLADQPAPERVQVTVRFALDAADGSTRVAADGPHSVMIEFKSGTVTGLAGALPPAGNAGPAPAAEEDWGAPLVEVFGAPGFDSSARATVFRETLAEVSHADALAALTALAAGATVGLNGPIRHVTQVLRGIIQSGPTKDVVRGATRLRAVLDRQPLAELLRLVESRWKTQDDWL